MIIVKVRLVVLIFLASWCLGGSNAMAACPGEPRFNRQTILHFSGEALPAAYNHSLTTAQIETMRHGQPHSGSQHNPGLTLAEHQIKTDYQIGGMKRGRGGATCVWVESLQVLFGFSRMDVFLSSQYAEGTCAYGVVRDHEDQHVAINTRVYRKYRLLMESALKRDRTIPMKGNPLAVRSMEQGKTLVASRVNRLIQPLYERFKREMVSENSKIDTAANYKRTQAKCKEWQ